MHGLNRSSSMGGSVSGTEEAVLRPLAGKGRREIGPITTERPIF